jgi:hypothetical protein
VDGRKNCRNDLFSGFVPAAHRDAPIEILKGDNAHGSTFLGQKTLAQILHKTREVLMPNLI